MRSFRITMTSMALAWPLTCAGTVSAAAIRVSVEHLIEEDQIDDNTLGDDVWSSKFFNADPIFIPSPLLQKGDLLEIDLDFRGNCLKLTDNSPDSNESLNFFVSSVGGVGGGLTHDLSYNWIFTGVIGEQNVTSRVFTGIGRLQGPSGNGFANPAGPTSFVSANMLEGGGTSFCFCDVTLRLFVPTTIANAWQPSGLSLQVAADQVEVKPLAILSNQAGGVIDYNNAANWDTDAVPNAPDTVVRIKQLNANATLDLNTDVTIGHLLLDADKTVTVRNGAGGSLTFGTTGDSSSVIVVEGGTNHSFQARTTLNKNLQVDFRTGAVVNWTGTIGETEPGSSITINGKGFRGQSFNMNNSMTNTYTGGITIDNGTVVLNSSSSQGLPPPVNGGQAVATAQNGGTIDVQFNPSSDQRFIIRSGSMIKTSSARMGMLDVNTNLELEDDAIIGFESNSSLGMPGGIDPTKLNYGVASNALTENITIGSNSGGWIGMYGAPGQDTTHNGIVTVQGDAGFGSLGGTSMSVPHLAASAAQLMSIYQGKVDFPHGDFFATQLFVGRCEEAGCVPATLDVSNPGGNALMVTGSSFIGAGAATPTTAGQPSGRGTLNIQHAATATLADVAVGFAFGEDHTASGDGRIRVELTDEFTTRNLSIGLALGSGDFITVSGDIDVSAPNVSHRLVTVGSAQVSGGNQPSAVTAAGAQYRVTANDFETTAGGVTTASVSISAIPDGNDRRATVNDANTSIVTGTATINGNLDTGIVNGAVSGVGLIKRSYTTIESGVTNINGVVNAASMNLSAGMAGKIDEAHVNIIGGTTIVTPSFGTTAMSVSQITSFGTAQSVEPIYANGAVTIVENVTELNGDLRIRATNLQSAPPDGSSLNASLTLQSSELRVNGSVLMDQHSGVATINSGVATFTLNPSFADISRDLVMGERAQLEFFIQGLTRPVTGTLGDYGAIDAANATLNGELLLEFDFPGVQLGDMFEVIRLDPGGVFTGFFDETFVTGLPPGLTAQASVVGQSLLAAVVGTFGNFDGDHDVDSNDLGAFIGFWTGDGGQGATFATGDSDGDGDVDSVDLGEFIAAWTGSLDASRVANRAELVPEPSSSVLLLLALLGGIPAVRRRRQQTREK